MNSLSLHEKLDYSNADFAEVPHQRSAGDGFDSLQSYGERGSTQVEELFSKDEFCSLNETFEETLVFLRNRLQIQYARLRKELQSSMRNIVLQEMQKILTTAQQLRDQVLSLREIVKTQERMIARKDQVIDDLMADLRRANEKAEASIEANRMKTKQLVEHVIDKWWSRRLLQRALIAWKAYLSGTWKNRFLQRMKSEAYAECDRLKKDNENTTKHVR
ncbi:unnamed protein product [Dicrocoelium dendriticum]|nr:unnamed protein product [Dicrocoelium dendriticum]